VAATPAGEDRRAAYLADLGTVCGRRFDRTRDAADLDRAVALNREALAAVAETDANWPFLMTGVGIAYRKRGQATGVGTDLDQAVDCGTRALAAAPSGHPVTFFVVPDQGAVVTRLGMTDAPSRTHDPGGGVTGSGGIEGPLIGTRPPTGRSRRNVGAGHRCPTR
jgi:hypothetical protein